MKRDFVILCLMGAVVAAPLALWTRRRWMWGGISVAGYVVFSLALVAYFALAGGMQVFIGLLVAAAAVVGSRRFDGLPFDDPPNRLVEESFWRAIRYGLDGKLIDLDRVEEYPASAVIERLLSWTAPARAALGGVEPLLPEENGAQRQRRALEAGASIEEVFAAEVAETQRTYAAQEVKA